MLQCNRINNILFYSKFRLFYAQNWVLVYINENTKHCPQLSQSSYYTCRFTLLCLSSDIWYKINKLLKYYEYQLTKLCSEGGQEGFKVSSWFLKIMNLVEYQIAKKCLNFHHRCTYRWLHHHYS